MKKLLTGLAMTAAVTSITQADMLRVEMGGGVWQNEFSGTIISKELTSTPLTTDLLNYGEESKPYLWVFIKHPVPILPNVRLEYASVDYSGTSTQSFNYKGQTYQANSQTSTVLDQYDIILYYNILDNLAWTTLDLGLDVKVIESSFKGSDSLTSNSVNVSETLPVPMLYARGRVEVPGTGIGLEGLAKYSGYKSSKVLDYTLKADYTLVDILPVDVGLEVGYRHETLDIDGSDFSIDTSADVEIDGIFAGAVIRF